MGANSSKSPPNGGLRVHRVYPNGPGDVAGIEPFFDFVLDADGYTYTDDSDETLNLFTKYVSDHENQQICLNVFNARKKTIREVFIVPQKWDGIGFLGLTLKFGLFNCLDEGAHIVHVYDKSPAQRAGLMPITDYLLGTNLQLFYDLDCVRIHVANQVDKEVVLIVYNSVTETVRRAVIVPRENWGGKGTLGCDLAKGYIHRIPYVKSLFSYPSIETYSTFDSHNNGEVVDTIDLSIGNVDNYYNNSVNSSVRQVPMDQPGPQAAVPSATPGTVELEVKLDGSDEPVSDHESHVGDIPSSRSQLDESADSGEHHHDQDHHTDYYRQDSGEHTETHPHEHSEHQHHDAPGHQSPLVNHPRDQPSSAEHDHQQSEPPLDHHLHPDYQPVPDHPSPSPNLESEHPNPASSFDHHQHQSDNSLLESEGQKLGYEGSPESESNYERPSDTYKPPSMLNLQSDLLNLDLLDSRNNVSAPNHKDSDFYNL